jgi:hypothetical protein
LLFDELLDFFCVVDVTVVENKNTAGSRIGIGQGYLALDEPNQKKKKKQRHLQRIQREMQ